MQYQYHIECHTFICLYMQGPDPLKVQYLIVTSTLSESTALLQRQLVTDCVLWWSVSFRESSLRYVIVHVMLGISNVLIIASF